MAQWPVGRLSDRFDRRVVLLALLVTSAVVGVALAVLPLGNMAVLVMAFPLGATLHACYPIAVAHTFDYADRGEYVHTSAGLLFANGLGSMVGPIAASALMGAIGAGGLFVFSALAQVGLSGFILYRLQRRASLTADMKVGFDLGATSQRGAVLTPEPLDPNDPGVAVPRDGAPEEEEAPDQRADAPAEQERPPTLPSRCDDAARPAARSEGPCAEPRAGPGFDPARPCHRQWRQGAQAQPGGRRGRRTGPHRPGRRAMCPVRR